MNKEKLKAKLDKYNIEYNNDSVSKLIQFNDDMLEYNSIHNLTTITEEDEVILKHFVDSLLPYRELSKNVKIIDIGCGGGFPSIPLAIINKNFDILAIDSIRKKTDFVQKEANSLLLPHLKVKNSRIEDIAHNPEYRETFDIALSRAVAPLSTIIEYSAPLIKTSGKIIAYKGSNYEEELKTAENSLKMLNCKVKEIKKYHIEEIDSVRVAIIIEKRGKTPEKYPRGQNKPRISPL